MERTAALWESTTAHIWESQLPLGPQWQHEASVVNLREFTTPVYPDQGRVRAGG